GRSIRVAPAVLAAPRVLADPRAARPRIRAARPEKRPRPSGLSPCAAPRARTGTASTQPGVPSPGVTLFLTTAHRGGARVGFESIGSSWLFLGPGPVILFLLT